MVNRHALHVKGPPFAPRLDIDIIFHAKGKENNGHPKIMLANTSNALYVSNIVTLRVTKKSVVV